MSFDAWSDIGRTLLGGTAAHATLMVVLRISVKRRSVKPSAFDLLATLLVSGDRSALTNGNDDPRC